METDITPGPAKADVPNSKVSTLAKKNDDACTADINILDDGQIVAHDSANRLPFKDL
jgi:hypothetical protein